MQGTVQTLSTPYTWLDAMVTIKTAGQEGSGQKHGEEVSYSCRFYAGDVAVVGEEEGCSTEFRYHLIFFLCLMVGIPT